jgi:signal transduction histidine kinase
MLSERQRAYAYAGALTAITAGVLVLTPDARPSADPTYAPLGAALLAGALLTVRTRPHESGATLLLIPALAAEARFGLAALPAIAYTSLLASLVRRVFGAALPIAAASDTLAFALAYLVGQATAFDFLGRLAVFAVTFVLARMALARLAVWLGGPATHHPRADRPDPFVLLALAPLGALPLVAWQGLGDGGLLLGLGALFMVLMLVAEVRKLATVRAEVEAERDQLVRANALQRDLVHLITHELKNPLTAVLVYTQLVERALREDKRERLPGHVGHIRQSAQSLQQLVDNLLQLSRLEATGELPDAETIDLAQLVESVAADLEPLAEPKRLALRTELPEQSPRVVAPPLLLQQALSNLVSNAIKYTPDDGHVLVWARQAGGDGEVVLGVTDSGIGLSPEDLSRLFTRFFRSADPRARKERGSGLGLALTNAIITRIGGRIEVDSKLNEGTTFRIVLRGAGR